MSARNLLSRILRRWQPERLAPAAAPTSLPVETYSCAAEPTATIDSGTDRVGPPAMVAEPMPAPPPLACIITAHIQGLGDRRAAEDGWAGRLTGWGRFEGFSVACDAPGWRGHVRFQAIQGDRTLSDPVEGGAYCGTRGKMVPLHGFVVHVADGAPEFAGLYYQGVFQDKFRSGLLKPGTPCVSPSLAPLRAMRITTDPNADDAPADAAPPAVASTEPDPSQADSAADVGIWDEGPTDISVIAHIAGRGDTPAGADGWAGDPDGDRAVEGFSANHDSAGWSRDVVCRAVLPDGSLGPDVKGGLYCGTRGKGQPLHGFMLDIGGGRNELAGITYEGAFEGGFRSRALSPGEICVAPDRAKLVAMRFSVAKSENIRLVIWDLDETFWGGTLTEGGIVWREENAQIVRELALRGIISSICSKNDQAEVLRVLEEHGMRDHFVFPSIDWEAKGPRLAALIKDVQLRAPSVLFIDDNPLNRAEATQFVPGLNVRSEHCIADLLHDPLLHGKPDPGRSRLEHYRLLERRQADRARVHGDTAQFLRDSNITIQIEHDIEPHIDRAIELINRTNQLNFTKSRLPDQPDAPNIARTALRAQLSPFNVQAGLLRVQDRYGDYGYCGFYAIRRDMTGTGVLLHFAFSCRILGMGVETWLYRHLDRPHLHVAGPVLSDIFDEAPVLDWISVESSAGLEAVGAQLRPLRYVLARGACDMRALSHYFMGAADEIIEELQVARLGQPTQPGHSLIAYQGLRGMPALAVQDFAPFGFLPQDFDTVLGRLPSGGPAVWVFGFNLESQTPIYQHIETGALLPANIHGLEISAKALMAGGSAGRANPELVAHLRKKFVFFGQRPDTRIDDLFRDSLRLIWSQASEDVRIFVLLSNTYEIGQDGSINIVDHGIRHNAVIAEVAAEFAHIELLAPHDFMTREELAALDNAQHFDRIVYYRMFRHIAQKAGLET